MKSVLRMTVCAAAVAFAVPALAQSSDASGSGMSKPMHHHHKMMHHKGGKMSKYHGPADSSTAKLNEQSLQNAKSGTDASGASGMAPAGGPASAGSMAPPASGAMAPPASGTMAPPASGTMAPPASH